MKKDLKYKQGSNLSVVKIDAFHCWKCGDLFQKEGDKIKTSHHAIPLSFNPRRNIIIPVCKKCQNEIHNNAPFPEREKIKRLLRGMRTTQDSLVERYDRLQKILDNKKDEENGK